MVLIPRLYCVWACLQEVAIKSDYSYSYSPHHYNGGLPYILLLLCK